MVLRFLATAMIVAFGRADAGRSGISATAAQCEAASAFVEMVVAQFRGRRQVFGAAPFFFMEMPPPDRSWSRAGDNQSVSGPPLALVRDLTDTNALNVCPVMRTRLRAMHIRFGNAAVRWATRHRNERFRAVILTISLPQVSADGQHAVLGGSSYFGPLDGEARLIHLERDSAGRWQIASRTRLYVS
jgi:hypothetical protein